MRFVGKVRKRDFLMRASLSSTPLGPGSYFCSKSLIMVFAHLGTATTNRPVLDSARTRLLFLLQEFDYGFCPLGHGHNKPPWSERSRGQALCLPVSSLLLWIVILMTGSVITLG